jgi:hypothetical protein
VGSLLRAQGRHNMRPAHVHFLIYKPGFKTHISQVYLPDDPNIETDVQFGVTKALLGNYVRHEGEKPPAPGEGPVVFARLHLRHGAGHGCAARRSRARRRRRTCGRNICWRPIAASRR